MMEDVVGFKKRLVEVTEKLEAFLSSQQYNETNLLLMSSGTYDGLDFAGLKSLLPNN